MPNTFITYFRLDFRLCGLTEPYRDFARKKIYSNCSKSCSFMLILDSKSWIKVNYKITLENSFKLKRVSNFLGTRNTRLNNNNDENYRLKKKNNKSTSQSHYYCIETFVKTQNGELKRTSNPSKNWIGTTTKNYGWICLRATNYKSCAYNRQIKVHKEPPHHKEKSFQV